MAGRHLAGGRVSMKTKYFKFLFLIIGIFVLFAGTSYEDQDTNYELVLCKNVICNLPKGINDKFHTGEKIYGYLYLGNIQNGIHKVGFYWYNINNELQESYIKDINVTNESYNIWSWLRLNDNEVLYDVSFMGRWKVEVYIDGVFLTKKYFNVS